MKNLSRKEALEILNGMKVKIKIPKAAVMQNKRNAALDMAIEALKYSEIPNSLTDCISRQAVVKFFNDWISCLDENCHHQSVADMTIIKNDFKNLPSAQPGQHTCVNCGRTVNNGGWYADGRTRCPIEEHYALPKNGYCHLWEKRNVTDDDYPERREE